VVVEFEVVVYDGVIDVVCFKEMFERARSLFGRGLNVVDWDGGESNGCMAAGGEGGYVAIEAVDYRSPSYHWS